MAARRTGSRMIDEGQGARQSGPPDEELLRGIAAGDEEAFRVFFRRWAGPVEAFLRRAAGSRESGQDLLQETFVRVLTGAGRFEPRGSARAWMFRIAANLAYSRWRHERGQPVAMDIAHPAMVAGLAVEDDEVAARESGIGRDIARAVAALPENQRVVFLLKAEAGLTYDEIGEAMCCPPGTAKSRFHFAVQRLRTELGEWGGACGDASAPGRHRAR